MIAGAGRALKTVVVALAATAFMLVGLVPMGSIAPPRAPVPTTVDAAVALETGEQFFELEGLDGPQTYLADMRFLGWEDGRRDAARIRITRAQLVAASEGELAEQTDWSYRLAGRNVIASLADEAAEDLSEIADTADATVELYAVPNGPTVTLMIGRVVDGAAAASALAVTSLSTGAAPPGSQVTVYGQGFGALQRDSWVTVCGARAVVTAWSETSVTFVVPDGATRPGYVGVVVSGVTSNGLYFTPYAAPRLDDITPRDGSVGTLVTFTGTGFGPAQGSGWVSFAGALGQVVSWSDTEIRALVPRGAGAGYAGVVARGLSSNGVFFAPYGHPIVEDVTPGHALVRDRLTLEGRNFGSTQGAVLMGGVPLPVVSWSTTRVTVDVPVGTTSGYIGVTRDGAIVSNGVFVTVAPRVDSISEWWRAPGTQLTITGEGFGSIQGGKTVFVGGTSAEVISWSDTAVRVTIPRGARSGYVGVGAPDSCSNGVYLVVEEPAAITQVSTSTVTPGTQITVTGSGFGIPGPGTLKIGGSCACDVVSWTNTRIVARIPVGAATGYLGVEKQRVMSNGVWVQVLP